MLPAWPTPGPKCSVEYQLRVPLISPGLRWAAGVTGELSHAVTRAPWKPTLARSARMGHPEFILALCKTQLHTGKGGPPALDNPHDWAVFDAWASALYEEGKREKKQKHKCGGASQRLGSMPYAGAKSDTAGDACEQ